MLLDQFYSHVNYSVTKIELDLPLDERLFYSHVNYSVTKIADGGWFNNASFTVT